MEKIKKIIAKINDNISYIFLGIVFLVFLLPNFNKCSNEEIVKTIYKTDTIYVEKIVKDTVPKIIYKYLIKYERDTLYTKDSIPVEVQVPIYSTKFSNTLYNKEDTVTYNAYVSGYKSKLDSIDIKVKYPKIINNTTNIYKENKKFELKHGLQVGAGYGFINKKPDLFVGYGIQINF